MIYTLTLSPSIDYYVLLENLYKGKINRSKTEYVRVGGKGINVSKILKEFDIDSIPVIFTAGFTKDKILEDLNNSKLSYYEISVGGMNRINVKISAQEETAINTNGLYINNEKIKELLEYLKDLQDGDYLVLSGSIPNGVDKTVYKKIVAAVADKDIKVIVDAEKDLLLGTLSYHPYLIKPNLQELEDIAGRSLSTESDIYKEACKLIEKGALNVLVSLGEKGILYVSNDLSKIYLPSIDVNVINTTGAGDSLVAGVLAGVVQNKSLIDSLKLGLACACATVESGHLANRYFIDQKLKLIK
jgi:1-phosphofructokinase